MKETKIHSSKLRNYKSNWLSGIWNRLLDSEETRKTAHAIIDPGLDKLADLMEKFEPKNPGPVSGKAINLWNGLLNVKPK